MIVVGEIIGQGQFGDVHQGLYRNKDNEKSPVAVKTCKNDSDSATTDKFLEEACKCILVLSYCERKIALVSNLINLERSFKI